MLRSFALAIAGLFLSTSVALAQFTAPAANNVENLLGTSTSGSETGVYELSGMVESAIPVILGISLLWVGWSIARRVVMSFRRS